MGRPFRGIPQNLDPSGCQPAGTTSWFFTFPEAPAPLNCAGLVCPACALGYPRCGQSQIPNEATSSEADPSHSGAASTKVPAVSVQIAAAFSWSAIG
jgi:hypothetical protein